MGSFREAVRNWLMVHEAPPAAVTLVESQTYDMAVFKNQMWYRGDAAELHQFYLQTDDNLGRNSFWGATSSTGIPFRKVHAGLPALMVDLICDIVSSDFIGISLADERAQARWEAIAQENGFTALLKTALRKALVEGDGAFKLSYDPAVSARPIIEFCAGSRVEYLRQRGRLREVRFKTRRPHPENRRKTLELQERYSSAGIAYALCDERGEALPLAALPEANGLVPLENPAGFWMAVPLLFEESAAWPGRGKSLFEGKLGAFDGFDECVSQWLDALRDARSTKYIPETMLPRSPVDGRLLKPNSFDNRYVVNGADLSESGGNHIVVVAGEIPHEALLASYVTLLELCLQGVLSPSTLGVDVKKLDNAEAQREKEKVTLYTRNRVVRVLERVLPQLAAAALKTEDLLLGRAPGEYPASAAFGEYANPSFEAQVETVGKARQYGILSLERCVEELYGGGLTEAQKAAECERLKAEFR